MFVELLICLIILFVIAIGIGGSYAMISMTISAWYDYKVWGFKLPIICLIFMWIFIILAIGAVLEMYGVI